MWREGDALTCADTDLGPICRGHKNGYDASAGTYFYLALFTFVAQAAVIALGWSKVGKFYQFQVDKVAADAEAKKAADRAAYGCKDGKDLDGKACEMAEEAPTDEAPAE